MSDDEGGPLLQPIALFGLAPDFDLGESELLRAGAPTGVTLPGLQLEAQLAFGPDLLLILSNGAPHEESLRIRLLDAKLRQQDGFNLDGPFTPGRFQLGPVGRSTLLFAFPLDQVRWRLSVHEFAVSGLRTPSPAQRAPLWRYLRPKRLDLERVMATELRVVN
jgi:hypothetical protein